ncbi:hypothetical protein [Pontibacter sp. SGAir0037]|uniref:hypothetical protein n=1 Tax=Pontibacter sp. SGAir0037 TaxID=2571030 RepID=UPI0010CCF886|nr:hypothetical protein [Pontibacter sp. SGAir0037]QCR22858.1 hypothetical protein C1N53_11225 [Pontibacter sp. SGAir0037]
MKINNANIDTEIEYRIPVSQINDKHLREATNSNIPYFWEFGDYQRKRNDKLYCIVDSHLVQFPIREFVMIAWYDHYENRGEDIPASAIFYIHKKSNKVFMLPNFDYQLHVIAVPIDFSAPEVMDTIEGGGNDSYQVYRERFKKFNMVNRKKRIKSIIGAL